MQTEDKEIVPPAINEEQLIQEILAITYLRYSPYNTMNLSWRDAPSEVKSHCYNATAKAKKAYKDLDRHCYKAILDVVSLYCRY